MKLLISDYDGTLKTDEINIKLNVEAIMNFRRNDNHFVIATGRSFSSIKKEIVKYGIPYDYLITNDGAIILDNSGHTIYAYDNYHDVLAEFREILNLNGYNSKLYTAPNSNKIVELEVSINESESFMDFSYFLSKYPDIIHSTVNIEMLKYIFYKEKTNKSIAIKKMLELIDNNYEKVITVGNDINDMEMLLDFNGFRMKTSEACLTQQPFEITEEVHTLIKRIG